MASIRKIKKARKMFRKKLGKTFTKNKALINYMFGVDTYYPLHMLTKDHDATT